MSGLNGTLATLAVDFALLSLLAFGGANVLVPELHRQAVEVAGWMSDRQFAELVAISQAAPGPNIIIATLVGFHVAGLPGALVATAAVCTPTCILAYHAGYAWERFKDARWRSAVQAGLVPISVGLIAATALILARAADHNLVAVIITGATAGVAYATRINPLWMFFVAGVLGLAGLV